MAIIKIDDIMVDVQIYIFSFLQANDIIFFYHSCCEHEKIIQELSKHVGFKVNCQSEDDLEWLDEKNIPFHVVTETYSEDTYWYLKELPSGKKSRGKLNYFVNYMKLDRGNDLPAVILKNGNKIWYQNGYLERDKDKPAFIYNNGIKVWYFRNKEHRKHGLPAYVDVINGEKRWYLYGILHRDNDLPAVIKKDGTQIWYKNGIIHREGDQPAHISYEGTQTWYKKGKLHRDHNKPAIVFHNGNQSWYENGILIKKELG